MCDACSEKITTHSFKVKVLPENSENEFTVVSPFLYDTNVKQAILAFKFNNREDYATPFANAIFNTVIKYYPDTTFDVVTSTPLHKSRLKERGYNQAELLAKVLAKKLGIKYKRLIVKVKNSLIQHELDYEKRKTNVIGVYKANNETHIKNKRILLCDDIITSGNTMNECAKVLKYAGARDIVCAAIAVARKI